MQVEAQHRRAPPGALPGEHQRPARRAHQGFGPVRQGDCAGAQDAHRIPLHEARQGVLRRPGGGGAGEILPHLQERAVRRVHQQQARLGELGGQQAVEDVQVVGRALLPRAGQLQLPALPRQDAKSLQPGHGGEELLQEEIAPRGEQGAAGLPRLRDGVGAVVQGQQVQRLLLPGGRAEAGRELRGPGGQLAGGHPGALAGGQGQLLGLEELPAGVEGEQRPARLPAVVHRPGEELAAGGGGPQGEGRQGQVLAALAHLQVARLARQPGQALLRQPAVRYQHHRRLLALLRGGGGGGGRQRKGRLPVGRALRNLSPLQRRPQLRAVAGVGDQDLRLAPRQDQGHARPPGQVADQVRHPGAGGFEAVRGHVGGVHRGRGVQQHHHRAGKGAGDEQGGAGQGKNQGRQDQ